MRAWIPALLGLLALAAGIVLGIAFLGSGADPEEPGRDSRAGRPARREAPRDSTAAPASDRASTGDGTEPAENPRASSPVASVAGLVVSARDGAPVPGVAVFLEPAGRSGGEPEPPAPGPLRTDSDGAGTFRLARVPPGSYAVYASGAGWSCVEPVPVSPEAGDAIGSIVVEVAPGGAVSGIVTDRLGSPVPGATVTVARGLDPLVLPGESDAPVAAIAARRSAMTNDGGLFLVAGLPEGRFYEITASCAGFLPAKLDGVEVRAREETRDLVLRLIRGGSLRGTVIAPDGRPVAGASVSLGVAARADWFGAADDEPAVLSTVTDEAGAFAFDAVPPGRRPLVVDAEGFVPWTRDYVKIEEGVEHAPVAAVLDPGLAIRGRVLDDAGVAREGAVVTAAPHREGDVRRGRADAAGVYVIWGLEATTYVVEAGAPGLDSVSRVRIPAGSEGVDFRLPRRAAVAGSVRRPDGSPVKSPFGVRASRGGPARAAAEASFSDPDGRFVIEDAPSGRISVSASSPRFVDSDPVTIEVAPATIAGGLVLLLKEAGGVRGVVRRAVDDSPLEGALVTLGVREFDPREFRRRANARDACVSGPDGRFTLEPVPPGKRAISVAHPDFATEFVFDIFVTEGSPAGPIVVHAKNGGGVFGDVFGPDGQPEEGAFVALVSGRFNVRRSTFTDSLGAYALRGARPGKYRVLALLPRRGSRSPFENARSAPVEIAADSMVQVDFRESRGGTRVDGTVTDEGGPVEGAIVVATAGFRDEPDDAPIDAARTDALGAFAMAGLAPGRTTFHVLRNRGARPFVVRDVVPDTPPAKIDITVPFGGFSGRVFDASTQAALAGFTVSVTAPGPGGAGEGPGRGGSRALAVAITDEAGRYLFERLTPGSYRAEARSARGGRFEPREWRNPYAPEVRDRIPVEEETLTRNVDFALRRR